MPGRRPSPKKQNAPSRLRFLALATDGDATLLKKGKLLKETSAAMDRFLEAGGKIFLVTGETVKELQKFPRLDAFHYVVAENGGVLYHPVSGKREVVAPAASQRLVNLLRKRRVRKVKAGEVIVTAKAGQKHAIAKAIRDLGLPHQIVRNRKDLLILPPDVDKATGLARLLRRLRLPANRVAAVGDAENDLPFLELCGLSVAVSNAVSKVKTRAPLITRGRAGRGVAELIDRILKLQTRPERRSVAGARTTTSSPAAPPTS